jgi:two-component system chemotaxis response regulator CheY
MHGFDVLSKLRQMDQEARIIVASADIQSSTHAMVKALGHVAFVTKPFSAEQVIEAVNAAIEGESYGIE